MSERIGGAPERRLPLDGVRIVSQALVWAGPFATLILSDLGAEIIEVESIQHLNPTRTVLRHIPKEFMEGRSGAHFVGDEREGFWNRQAWFNYGKRGCKSVTLDLRRDRGRELFYDLIRDADVFIENNAAEVVGHLGIDYETLRAINPQLIMVRFPGFGISGPYSHFKGYGNVMEALAGHTLIRGYEDSDPSMTPVVLHCDPNAGAHVAFVLQVALYARERSGVGQLIELSQEEAIMQHLTYSIMDYSMNRRVRGPRGNRHPSMAPHGIYPCAGEDRWIAIAVPTDGAFTALCEELGRPDLAEDPDYADVVSRHRNQRALDAIVAEWTAQHDHHALMLRLQAAGIPAAKLAHQEELFDDPQLLDRGFFEELTHPEAGTHPYAGPMAHFERYPLSPLRGPAPLLGQHNHEVLCGLLGLDEADYRQLVEDEIIGTVYTEDAT